MSSASDRRKSSGSSDIGGGAYWMDTYGDLVTLLLTFFVLLFSFSSLDSEKWQALLGSFAGTSLVGILDPITAETATQSPIPIIGMPSSQSQQDSQSQNQSADSLQDSRQMFAILSGFIEEADLEAEVVLDEDEYLVRVIFEEQVFFDTADARLRPDSYPTLDTVVEMLKAVEHLYSMVIVEGHADSRPISTLQYPSNWHISAYRAVNVAGYIQNAGELDERRIAAMGFGDKHPVRPNDSLENMAYNRRVEFKFEAGSFTQRNRELVE